MDVCSTSHWAARATASSDWSAAAINNRSYPAWWATGWGVAEMLGEPDAGGECSDRGSAWAPSHNGSAAEWVRLEFGDEPLRMIGLQVREVLAAPFILRVEVESEEAQRWTIWNGTDETPCPGWFDLSYDSGSQAIAAVYIFTQADGFEEIDAVSLEVPIPCSPSPPPESPSTPLPAFAVLTARPLAVVLALVAAWLLLFAYLCLRVRRRSRSVGLRAAKDLEGPTLLSPPGPAAERRVGEPGSPTDAQTIGPSIDLDSALRSHGCARLVPLERESLRACTHARPHL